MNRPKFLNQDAVAPIDFTRAESRETLRDIVFLWTTPFCADFIMRGSAAFKAVSAAALSPAAMAVSTARTVDRRRDRRVLLTSVRRNV